MVNRFLHPVGALQQIVVEQHHCRHGLYDRHSPWHDARVVPPACLYYGGIPGDVYCLLLCFQCGNGLECHAESYVHAVGDSALHSTAVVCCSGYSSPSVGDESVVIIRPRFFCGGKPVIITYTKEDNGIRKRDAVEVWNSRVK